MTDTTNDNTVTLKSICTQLKIDPYDARVKLRSARSDAKQFPHLAKHKAGHAWAWPKNSPAIKEVKAALKNGDASYRRTQQGGQQCPPFFYGDDAMETIRQVQLGAR